MKLKTLLMESLDDNMEIIDSPSKERTINRTGWNVKHSISKKTGKPWIDFIDRIPGRGHTVLVDHGGGLHNLTPVKLTSDFRNGRANYEFDGIENELKIYTDRDRDGNIIYLMFQNTEI